MNDRIARAALTRLFDPQDATGRTLVGTLGAYPALRVATGVQPGGATIKCAGDLLDRRMGTVARLLIGGAGAPEALILAIRDDGRVPLSIPGRADR